MCSLLRLAVVFAVAGCSRSEPAKKPPGETIGIVLEGDGGPRLQVRVSFEGGVAPEPHVQPIAAALANARAACFAQGIGTEVVAVVHAKVHAKQIHTISNNAWGDCLAKTLEGASIEDANDFEIDLSISVASSK